MVENPFLLSHNQRRALDDLSSLQGKELGKRARIILSYADSQDMKAAAEENNVHERTVSRWVQRYQAEGLEGLRPNHPGISLSKKEQIDRTMDDIRTRLLQEGGNSSPKEIAVEFGLSVSTVYRYLEKLGVSTNTKRSSKWTYSTIDRQLGNSPYLVGIFLSKDIQLIVMCETSEVLQGKTIHGVTSTRNENLYKKMEKSAATLRMVDAVVAATEHSEFQHAGECISANQFLTEAIDEWPTGNDYRYKVYSTAHVCYQGLRMEGICYCWADDFKAWSNQVLQCFLGIDHVTQYNVVGNDLRTMEKYVMACTKASEPFTWRMIHGEYTPLATILSSPTESIRVADSLEDINQALEVLFPNIVAGKPPTGGTLVGTVICMQESDGQLSYRAVSSNALFPEIDEDCFRTEEGFDCTINNLDRQMTILSQKVNFAGRELFLSNVKKKDMP